MKNNEVIKKILEFIEKRKNVPTTTKEVMQELNISFPTASKWLEVLAAGGKIKKLDYGNIKFYYPIENENEKK